MRVVAGGTSFDLGTTENTPKIGITDYSRRVTDDFGVTTVVERGFSRRMSVRLGIPFDQVDGVQRTLAGLRATPASWVASEDLSWLKVDGFYKDFEVDLAVPPLSYCTLTVEGLAETETVADAGGDPAPTGQASTLQLLQPVEVADPNISYSSVTEADYAAWSAGTTYPATARVIRAHRIYESAIAGNVGHDPVSATGQWSDVGPTNRWAMFDQALGTASSAASPIVVTLNASVIKAVALLDVVATSVRVQATGGYDRTQAVGAGALTFLDLPPSTGLVTVTISGASTVSVGTLLIGDLVKLGVTEASPTAGITDYSRKEVDDFGAVTVVQRAWAKRMTAKALIRTDALDVVANRIAAVRARPSLWLGQSGSDSLTVYGFFKDFSIEVDGSTSKLSLSIEGLSKAAPIAATVPPLVPRGAYDAGTEYGENDVVTYQGSSWRYAALVASLGHSPPSLPTESNDWWRIFARAGDAGAAGVAGAGTFTLVPGANVSITPNSVTKTSGAAGWDAGAYSLEGFAGDVMVIGRLSSNAVHVMLGLNSDPATDDAYATMDFAAYCAAGVFAAYENGSQVYGGAFVGSGEFIYVRRRGTTIEYGVLGEAVPRYVRTGVSAATRLYLDSSIFTPGASLTNLSIQPLGADGGAGISPPLITIAKSRDVVTYSKADAITSGAITFTTIRQNSTATPTFVVMGLDGTVIAGPDTAAGFAAYKPSAYSTTGADNLTITQAEIAGIVAAYGGLKMTAAITGSMATCSLPKVKDGADGAQGPQGSPGTNGTNGSNGAPAYVHFAWADSADGATNFTTGAPGTRAYIGVYTDSTVAGSGSAGAYTWSRYKGANGADGANGTPGAPGANGQPTYVHTAYANSADGSTSFSTTDPAGRAYLGVLVDLTLADSTNYADYTWSLIRGSDGAPGATGANALLLDSNVQSLSFAADFLGNLKAGQISQTIDFSFTDGGANVDGSTTWSTPECSGCTGSTDATGLFTPTAVTADGYVRQTATYGGVPRTKKVPISLNRDTTPPSTDADAKTGVSGDVTASSYGSTPAASVLVTVTGTTLHGYFDFSYSPDARGNSTLSSIFGYRLAGSTGAWSYFGSTTGSQARIAGTVSEPINEIGSIAADQTTTVSAGRYELGVFPWHSAGGQTATGSGTLRGKDGA